MFRKKVLLLSSESKNVTPKNNGLYVLHQLRQNMRNYNRRIYVEIQHRWEERCTFLIDLGLSGVRGTVVASGTMVQATL
jgi:hypothetical protein